MKKYIGELRLERKPVVICLGFDLEKKKVADEKLDGFELRKITKTLLCANAEKTVILKRIMSDSRFTRKDVDSYRNLLGVLQLLEIEIVDFVIVSNNDTASFKDLGFLPTRNIG